MQWTALGTSGPPGAFVHPHAVAVIVTVPALARCLRTEESLAAAHRDKLSFATSPSAQVRQASLDLDLPFYVQLEVPIKTSVAPLAWFCSHP